MTSVVCLIYRSPAYADAVFRSVAENTTDYTFRFVANEPTPELLAHLEARGYPYLLHRNPPCPSEAELFRRGIGAPAYLHNVYRAWNFAVRTAPTEDVCLVNSDMMFSPGWLDALRRHLTDQTVVASQLVERSHPRHGVFPDALERDFGTCPGNFDERGFRVFADEQSSANRGIARTSGAYGPLLFRNRTLLDAGGYPEGNLHDGTCFENVGEYGDECLIRHLAERGVRHVTAMDSIVYHFKEGEMEECGSSSSRQSAPATQR
jgi:hypothetical protein